ncbi:MAG: hypothetical protein KJP21_02725 [Bacteroidia bacterium]|nr:hypothetical protein [Bacteroidia bacterium]NNJ56193.1 hypothetical protein [Bacteroidia bacterium]
MPFQLLYIEDDSIDVIALNRVLRHFEKVDLTVCGNVADLYKFNLSEFDYILSDSNLPDGSLNDLKAILPLSKTQFISGSEIVGENVWIKPIEIDQIQSIFNKSTIVNMKYINDLADGDNEYVQEMIATALSVLPQRWVEISSNKNDLVLLRKAAHKAKSSYRVCGIQNQWLAELESLDESSFQSEQKDLLLAQIEKQIHQAIEELNKLKI